MDQIVDHPAWQVSAAAMDGWPGRHDGPSTRATALLLERAAAARGEKVLEVSAGAGNEAVELARVVGPKGCVLATDISEDMLRAARAKARAAGLDNIECRRMDAGDLDVEPGSFDLVFCRMSVMLLPNPAAALYEMYAALRPGGRVAVMVFSAPEKNPLHAVSMDVIRARRRMPRPVADAPGYFRFGAPGALESAVAQAGFAEVKVETVAGERRMSPEMLRRFLSGRAGGMRALLSDTDPATRESVLDAVEGALGPYRQGTEYAFNQEFLIATGRKPG
jgi:ubiquinone/menaquinone biosynthesis C-methylase UbiE